MKRPQQGGSGPTLLAPELRRIKLQQAFGIQLFTGNALIAIAIYLFLPIPTPSLWLLDDWGGLNLPPFAFPIIFLILGIVLSFNRRVWLSLNAMMIAFVLVATIGAAAYLTLGINAMPILCGVWLGHIGRTVVSLKGILREVQAGRCPESGPGGGAR